ncbi:MAG: AzlD domain-containing protein [Lachnospiraceae bacterium]|nr:AzlD domain-containing protein [Lachnospiraceae bacterium]
MADRVYIYILVMAAVTFLIRSLPLTLIRKEIKSPFIKSFLYYVPYVTLSAMTVPAIFSATAGYYSAAAGFITALVLAFMRKSLLVVAAGGCIAVFIVEKLQVLL